MIPTHEQIDAYSKSDFASVKVERWLRAMRDEIDRLQAHLDRANTEAAMARDAMAKASDPVREEEIKAWRDWALGDIADPDLYDDCFVLSHAEIDDAVSLMRSAGDPDAKLRELRAWIRDEWSSALEFGSIRRILDGIDEMLAQPAPGEQPAAAVPDHVPDAGKMVPDDTRELVAQLADALTICPGLFQEDAEKFKAIAAKLRGGA